MIDTVLLGRPGTEFLNGGGKTGALIAARDWSVTPLGPLQTWPQSLRTAAALLLRSPVPMVMLWGEDGVMLYNDAYSVFAGGRHPGLLGSKVREGWPEVADFNDNVMKVGLAGDTLAYKDQELTLYRHGRPEQVWMNLDYSPVLDEAGEPAGVLAIVIETTERVRAERELRQERDRSRGVLDSMAEGFVLLDREFRVLDVNAEGLRIDGRTASDVIGRSHWEVWPDTEQGELGRVYKQAMADRAPFSAENRYTWPDGHEAWLEVRGYPTADGLAIFYRDVTERKRAEAALVESEQRLRLVVDGATGYAIFTIDPERRVTSWSQGAAEVFGYTADEMIGHLADAIYTPEDRAAGQPVWEVDEARRTGCAPDERWHLRKDGSRVFINGSVHPLPRDAQGREQGFIKIARDETEQRRASEMVAESEARFRNMADQSPVMMWVTDPSGYCTYLNRRWYEFTGQEEGAGEAYGWLDAVHPEDRPAAEDAFVAANAEQRDYRIEFRVRRADGIYRWAIDAAAVRFGADGEYLGYVGSIIDIDERRDAELALQASTAQAEALAAEQAAILDQLAEGVIVTDRDGRITFVNDAAARIHGVAHLDVEPDDYADTYHLLTIEGEPYPPLDLPLARAVRNGETVTEARWKVRRPDGSEVVAVGSARPVLDPAGTQIGAVLTLRDDTERTTAEHLLRENEARLRALTDNLPSGMVYQIATGRDGSERRFLFVSQSHEKLTGIPADAVLADPSIPYHLILPEHRAELVEAEAEAIRKRKPFDVQVRFRRADGEVRWSRIISAPREQVDGSVIWDGIQIDITDQKQAEENLRASEAKFEAISNSIDQMVWSTLPDGYHDFYNQRWYDYTGVPPGSTDGEAWNGMFHPDDRERAWATWRHSLETGETYRIEYRLRHRSGQYRWVLGRAQAVRDESGRITRWFGTCTEIEDIVEAREVLARSREDLEQRVNEALAERKLWADVFESSDALIGALGLDRRYLAVNRAYADEFERIFGVRPKMGDSLPALLETMPEHRAAALAIWDRALSGEEFTVTEEFGDPNRARPYYELRFNPLRDDAGRIIGAFQYAIDVTERLRDQARLAQTEEALRQSQKMEAVGQLTGGIAHDFNNMLAVVIGSLDLLGRRIGTGDARAKRYVDAATDGARRAALLTQRLLAFSRQQPLRPEPVDANKLVAGMSDLLRHSLGGAVQLETVLAGGLWRTHADPNQLENVILNLAVNARDAMPDGGKLTIETQNTHLDSRYTAAHLGVTPGQYVLIAVTDTGTGMPEDVMSRAFDPFFTTKEVGKGTGLGLSQVYGFVKQSGGHVKIYSEPGHGTTFKVYLPRYFGAMGEIEPEDQAADVPLGERQEVVLVVEDEPAVRQFSVDALSELGYRVLEADGAGTALKLLDAHPEIALIFTDVVMPEVNGAKLAEEVRRRRPDVRILFTTGYTRNAVVHNGVLDPGTELIGKPFTIEELAAKVRGVLDAPVPSVGT